MPKGKPVVLAKDPTSAPAELEDILKDADVSPTVVLVEHALSSHNSTFCTSTIYSVASPVAGFAE